MYWGSEEHLTHSCRSSDASALAIMEYPAGQLCRLYLPDEAFSDQLPMILTPPVQLKSGAFRSAHTLSCTHTAPLGHVWQDLEGALKFTSWLRAR
jgi:hypothetical protein